MVKPGKIFGAAALAMSAGAAVVSAFAPTYHQQQQSVFRPQGALHATLTQPEPIMTSSSSTILDRPITLDPLTATPITTPQIDETTQSHPSSPEYILRIYNDNINTREYVAVCLVQVVGLCESRAYYTMQDAHDNGIAKVGEYNQEVAECYEEQLVERGIMCDVVESE